MDKQIFSTNKKVLILIGGLVFGIILLFLIRSSQNPPSQPEPTATPIPSASTSVQIIPLESPQGKGVETEEYKKAEQEYVKNTPVLQKLPAKSSFFDVTYISETHLIVNSKTTDRERDYQVAREWFLENNIDIDQITIEYK